MSRTIRRNTSKVNLLFAVLLTAAAGILAIKLLLHSTARNPLYFAAVEFVGGVLFVLLYAGLNAYRLIKHRNSLALSKQILGWGIVALVLAASIGALVVLAPGLIVTIAFFSPMQR